MKSEIYSSQRVRRRKWIQSDIKPCLLSVRYCTPHSPDLPSLSNMSLRGSFSLSLYPLDAHTIQGSEFFPLVFKLFPFPGALNLRFFFFLCAQIAFVSLSAKQPLPTPGGHLPFLCSYHFSLRSSLLLLPRA